MRLDSSAPLLEAPDPATDDLAEFRLRLARAKEAWDDSGLSKADRAGRLLRIGDALSARETISGETGPVPNEMRGRAELALGNYRAALRWFTEATGGYPDSVAAILGKSRALRFLGRREAAASALESAIQSVQVQTTEAALAVADELDTIGDLQRALAVARTAGEGREARFLQARLLFKLQRLDDSRTLLESLLEQNPRDSAARFYLASILVNPLYARPDPARSEHLLLQNLEDNPSEIGSLRAIGELLLTQKRFQEAAHAHGRLLQLESRDASSRLQLSRALQGLGSEGEASRQRSLAMGLLADDRARERAEGRRNQEPGSVSARLALATLNARQGNYQRAWPELQAAVALSKAGPDETRALSALYRKAGMSPLFHFEDWRP
jgi:tetratricopeptide (TPR) repeat protein